MLCSHVTGADNPLVTNVAHLSIRVNSANLVVSGWSIDDWMIGCLLGPELA